MRDLKFRGQRIADNKWSYGYLCMMHNNDGIITPHIQWHSESAIGYSEVKPETVGQLTGLRDKNGKDIYEGDIFHSANPDKRFVVEYSECSFGLRNVKESEDYYFLFQEWYQDGEVIGNIYENAHLLKPATV